jgi:alpha-tubulin suppressor-like RCC1 family protein
MITSTEVRETIGQVLVLGIILASLQRYAVILDLGLIACLVCRLAGYCGTLLVLIERRCSRGGPTALTTALLAAAPAIAAVPLGKAFGWGSNQYGQLGNGSSGPGTAANLPVAVRDLSGVRSVKAGCNHGLALTRDGSVWAWGDNYYGQLGNGANVKRSLPVKVKLANVKAISAGCDHNLALKENGTVWAWGDNYYGQLGNGSSEDSSNVPVKVISLGTTANAVAAGKNFSLALMSNGKVKSWGYNAEGQLGDGTSGSDTNKSTPTLVSNLTNVKTISTDSHADHSLALLDDGTVRA